MNRFFTLFLARNREFYRDKGSLSWSLLFPFILIFGLHIALSDDDALYKVGLLPGVTASTEASLRTIPHLQLVPIVDAATGETRLKQQTLDLLVGPGTPPRYWINTTAPGSWFLESALKQQPQPFERIAVAGQATSRIAWLVPGVLAMSLMFSCLYGVGYVITRYRNLGVLKRLRATPISAVDFLAAQLASRLLISVSTISVVFLGSWWLFGFPVHGSLFLLLLVAIAGALSMIAISLLLAARIDSLELMNGVLNLLSWPMMLLAGLWFPLDDAPVWLQVLSQLIPLTHVVDAARAIVLEGAGLATIWPAFVLLLGFSAVCIALAARLFRWQST